MTLDFFYVKNVTSGECYVGGSYGGRFSYYPKLYRRASDADAALESIQHDQLHHAYATCHGAVKKGDVLEVRKATVTF